jgi:hypothetical protein
MLPKCHFLHRLFLFPCLDFRLLIGIFSLDGEEERGLSYIEGGEEGSSIQCRGRLDSNRGGSVSFFNELDIDNELC